MVYNILIIQSQQEMNFNNRSLFFKLSRDSSFHKLSACALWTTRIRLPTGAQISLFTIMSRPILEPTQSTACGYFAGVKRPSREAATICRRDSKMR